MLDWFKNSDPAVQGAVISGIVAIIVALITGIFGLIKRDKDSKNGTMIKQRQWIGNKGTQMGVQNNYTTTSSKSGEKEDE